MILLIQLIIMCKQIFNPSMAIAMILVKQRPIRMKQKIVKIVKRSALMPRRYLVKRLPLPPLSFTRTFAPLDAVRLQSTEGFLVLNSSLKRTAIISYFIVIGSLSTLLSDSSFNILVTSRLQKLCLQIQIQPRQLYTTPIIPTILQI